VPGPGAGAGAGAGANAGPGTGRSYYATPIDLGFIPWALDFTPDDNAFSPFPLNWCSPACRIEKDADGNDRLVVHQWQTNDWDPALRFWTLAFDPQLPTWLQFVDPTLPSILAAREFAQAHDSWKATSALATGALRVGGSHDDLRWVCDTAAADKVKERDRVNQEVHIETEQLKQLMEDDRDRFLFEIEVQADGLARYITQFIGSDQRRRPWTSELVGCGLAIGNVAYMHYKAHWRRVRPSFLCPGLVPNFGPPGHPSFPSGHSFLGHFIALLLLEIPALAERFGVFETVGAPGRQITNAAELNGIGEVKSPLIWLAQRLAKGRERLGVHYPSDSHASRHLAAAIWQALFKPQGVAIPCPTLHDVLKHARSEW
jgi:hypothetical protein